MTTQNRDRSGFPWHLVYTADYQDKSRGDVYTSSTSDVRLRRELARVKESRPRIPLALLSSEQLKEILANV